MKSAFALPGMVGGKIAGAALAMAATVFASRVLSLEDFGTISLIFSIGTILATILDFGSTTFVRKKSRAFSRSHSILISELLGDVIIFIAARAIVLLGIGFAIAEIFKLEFKLELMFWLVMVALGFSVELLLSETLRTRKFFISAEFIAGGLRQTIYVAIIACAAVIGRADVTFVATAYSLSLTMIALVLLALLGGLSFRPISIGYWQRALHLELVGERFRFFLVTGLNILLNQVAVVMAGYLSSPSSAGIVRVSLMFGMVMQLAVGSIAMYFAPRIGSASKVGLETIARNSSRLGLLGIPVALVGVLVTPYAIDLLFGHEYAEAALGAQILIFTYGIVSAFGAYGQIVLLRGGERTSIIAAITALAATILTILFLYNILPIEAYPVGYSVGILTSYIVLGIIGTRSIGVRPGPL